MFNISDPLITYDSDVTGLLNNNAMDVDLLSILSPVYYVFCSSPLDGNSIPKPSLLLTQHWFVGIELLGLRESAMHVSIEHMLTVIHDCTEGEDGLIELLQIPKYPATQNLERKQVQCLPS